MRKRAAVVWLHHDLRLEDNPALYHASQQADAVIPAFIWAPREEGAWAPGGASRWWLHQSLHALRDRLGRLGSRLILQKGASLAVLRETIAATGAEAVYWNTRYTPALHARDQQIQHALEAEGVAVRTFAAQLLHNPDALQTQSGGPYHVFTPFWRKFQTDLDMGALLPAAPLSVTHAPDPWPASVALDELQLTPEAQDGVDWAAGIRSAWTAGEEAAHQRLEHFIAHLADTYEAQRSCPALDGTSRLSPHLRFGEISPRQVWRAVASSLPPETARPFLRQLGWREFAYHLLHHYPRSPSEALRSKYNEFPWKGRPWQLYAWQRGRTGYPIVDAGMRQLWQTGWMHNRVRMIVSSFLTKDLLIPWQDGAAWFWDTLVDADLANNTLGWQWSAGSGADAQPFFRIFNPVSQGRRFDPEGHYVKQYVPELAGLPAPYFHAPWTAPPDVLHKADVALGTNYPNPIVSHKEARAQALEAYEQVR